MHQVMVVLFIGSLSYDFSFSSMKIENPTQIITVRLKSEQS